jgi:hypothetical protein
VIGRDHGPDPEGSAPSPSGLFPARSLPSKRGNDVTTDDPKTKARGPQSAKASRASGRPILPGRESLTPSGPRMETPFTHTNTHTHQYTQPSWFGPLQSILYLTPSAPRKEAPGRQRPYPLRSTRAILAAVARSSAAALSAALRAPPCSGHGNPRVFQLPSRFSGLVAIQDSGSPSHGSDQTGTWPVRAGGPSLGWPGARSDSQVQIC